MKFSELKGRAVVSLDKAQKLGEGEDLMIEPGSRKIVSVKVRTGLFSAAQFVPAAEVKSVGADAVMIAANAALAPPSAESAQALVALTHILGNKVVTDAGTFVGELRDILLDWANLTLTGYEVREGGLFAKGQEFTATPEVRFGDKIITMPAQLLNTARLTIWGSPATASHKRKKPAWTTSGRKQAYWPRCKQDGAGGKPCSPRWVTRG